MDGRRGGDHHATTHTLPILVKHIHNLFCGEAVEGEGRGERGRGVLLLVFQNELEVR